MAFIQLTCPLESVFVREASRLRARKQTRTLLGFGWVRYPSLRSQIRNMLASQQIAD